MTAKDAIIRLSLDKIEVDRIVKGSSKKTLESNIVNHFEAYNMAIEALEKIEEYKNLEEQGLLLRLPCKVGDMIYQIMFTGFDKFKKPVYEIFEAVVFKFTIDSIRVCFGTETKDEHRHRNEMTLFAFGETVFLTREEAEQKLKELIAE